VEKNGVQFLIVPEDGRDTISVRLSRRRLRLVVAVGVVIVGAVALLGGSWWYLAAQAARVPELERELSELEGTQEQVVALGAQLADLEGRYDRIRSLFGIDTARVLPEIWRPPGGEGRASTEDPESSRPTSWPLTSPGFVTRSLLAEGEGEADHPGLDIAIPSQSYIRAAGAGTVRDVEEDAVYGNFVTVDHGEGYLTLYAHASEILVESGQRVRRNEVIALSGNSGRSTAPHLHFEIRLDGEAVDPLTMVQPPG
jgi:murein DD-endopeptidase MepM/ murein hydrolase activator NlpD